MIKQLFFVIAENKFDLANGELYCYEFDIFSITDPFGLILMSISQDTVLHDFKIDLFNDSNLWKRIDWNISHNVNIRPNVPNYIRVQDKILELGYNKFQDVLITSNNQPKKETLAIEIYKEITLPFIRKAISPADGQIRIEVDRGSSDNELLILTIQPEYIMGNPKKVIEKMLLKESNEWIEDLGIDLTNATVILHDREQIFSSDKVTQTEDKPSELYLLLTSVMGRLLVNNDLHNNIVEIIQKLDYEFSAPLLQLLIKYVNKFHWLEYKSNRNLLKKVIEGLEITISKILNIDIINSLNTKSNIPKMIKNLKRGTTLSISNLAYIISEEYDNNKWKKNDKFEENTDKIPFEGIRVDESNLLKRLDHFIEWAKDPKETDIERSSRLKILHWIDIAYFRNYLSHGPFNPPYQEPIYLIYENVWQRLVENIVKILYEVINSQYI
jgi:hypothetical protein